MNEKERSFVEIAAGDLFVCCKKVFLCYTKKKQAYKEITQMLLMCKNVPVYDIETILNEQFKIK